MAETASFLSTKRYAVVTGANKGIGFGICKQLAAHGVVVVLTARDEKKGLEAVERLKNSNSGPSDSVIFHQLDVTDPKSIASLAYSVRTHFGKLDILVNNAGISGFMKDFDALRLTMASGKSMDQINWNEITTQSHELHEECIKTNYYGAKGLIEVLMPLLLLSDSARIVNVSSSMGQLKNLTNEWAKGILSDAENLTEGKIDEVLNEFLKDSKEGSLANTGWPEVFSAYITSKAALNAYTRLMAKKHSSICIKCALALSRLMSMATPAKYLLRKVLKVLSGLL